VCKFSSTRYQARVFFTGYRLPYTKLHGAKLHEA
ncbi:MAG: hypothetical protein ACI96M_001622, partial [Candidatus Azotimanducaceae bacterium]